MTDAMYWSVTNESSMPWRLRSSKICPRHGLSTMGTIGFGRLIVSGRRRLPSPPAMTTACIAASLVGWRAPAERRRRRTERRCVGHHEHGDRPCRAGHAEWCQIEWRASAERLERRHAKREGVAANRQENEQDAPSFGQDRALDNP